MPVTKPGENYQSLKKALGLPDKVIAFSIHFRLNELATVECEYLAPDGALEALTLLLRDTETSAEL